MATKTRQSLAQPDLQFGSERLPASTRQKLDRLTQSVRAIVAELQKVQQAMAGGSPGEVLEKTGSGDYEAAWGSTGAGTISGAKNLGPAGSVGIFKDVEGSLIALKGLEAGANVELVVTDTTITIVVHTGGDTGVGTVTSIGIDSADLDVVGSPVTSAGSITLTIKSNAVSYAKMQETSQDAVVLGRRTGEGAGDLEELTAADLRTLIGSAGYPAQLGYAGI
jgi:hypothetical protein